MILLRYVFEKKMFSLNGEICRDNKPDLTEEEKSGNTGKTSKSHSQTKTVIYPASTTQGKKKKKRNHNKN